MLTTGRFGSCCSRIRLLNWGRTGLAASSVTTAVGHRHPTGPALEGALVCRAVGKPQRSCNTDGSASSPGAGTSTNSGRPSLPIRWAPCSTGRCRWMFKLASEAKRWISVTAPLSACSTFCPTWPIRWRGMTRCTTCSTGVTRLGCATSSRRSGMGRDGTHGRTGTCGMTRSTRCAAICAMRRAPLDGQKPRRLQRNATNWVWLAVEFGPIKMTYSQFNNRHQR